MADAVIAKRLDVAEWAMKALAQLWAFTDPYDGASMKAFVGKAVRVMAAAQTSVAKTTTRTASTAPRTASPRSRRSFRPKVWSTPIARSDAAASLLPLVPTEQLWTSS